MEEKEIKEQAFEFAGKLRQVLPYYGFTTNAIYLIFLKYLSNYKNVKTQEQFETLMSFKNMFINKTYSKEVVCNTLKMMGHIYWTCGDFLSESIEVYSNIFKNEERTNLIFKILNEFNLPEEINDRSKFFNHILNFSYFDIRRSLTFTSNESLCKLISKILNVNENETYLDCYCGFFRSALNINARVYLGEETNIDIANASNMMMIMLEKNNFVIENETFIYEDDEELADKIFCDAFNGLRTYEDELKIVSRLSLYLDNFEKTLKCLSDEGVAIIAVPSKVLTNYNFEQLREEYTESNLKAVIALPPLWNGTNENTNLIVLEKNKNFDHTINKIFDDVIMIDASNEIYVDKVNKKINCLKNETINDIVKSLNGNIIEGFSKRIKDSNILNNEETSWHPQTYIKKKEGVKYRSSNEIKKELNEVYEELSKILK